MKKATTKNHLLNRIRQKAQQSPCRIRVAALGFNRNGDCVSAKFNHYKLQGTGRGNHAEAMVMAEARQKGIVRILICRIGGSGNFLPIDPCQSCQRMADKAGIIIDTVPEE